MHGVGVLNPTTSFPRTSSAIGELDAGKGCGYVSNGICLKFGFCCAPTVGEKDHDDGDADGIRVSGGE